MAILLTGITGFVGAHLQKKLQHSGYAVKDLPLRSPEWKNVIVPQVQAIIHLAGKAHDVKNTSNPKEYFDVNTKLTQEVFDAFLKSDCRDFIFFSSVKAVTDKAVEIVTEEMNVNPQSAYGQSKLEAEQYILSKMLPIGKRVFILRPSMIYGPGNKGNLNLLYYLVSKGIPWPLGAFKNERSFCSIDNVCYVIHQILEQKDIPSGIYNLADDETISTNELITIISNTINKKVKIYSISKKIISIIAVIGDLFHLPFNTERLDKLTENFIVSNFKIKSALNIKKFPTSAKVGLVKTIQSFI